MSNTKRKRDLIQKMEPKIKKAFGTSPGSTEKTLNKKLR